MRAREEITHGGRPAPLIAEWGEWRIYRAENGEFIVWFGTGLIAVLSADEMAKLTRLFVDVMAVMEDTVMSSNASGAERRERER